MKANKITTSLAVLAFSAMLTVSCSKEEKRPELPQGDMPQEQTQQTQQPETKPDTMAKTDSGNMETAKNDNKAASNDKSSMKGGEKAQASTPAANSNEHKGYFAILTKLAMGEEGRISGDPANNVVVFVTGGNAYYPIGEDGGYVGKIFGKKYGASQEVTVTGKIADRNGVSSIMITDVK